MYAIAGRNASTCTKLASELEGIRNPETGANQTLLAKILKTEFIVAK